MKQTRQKVVCFHLFNDFSGSPKVLRVVLQGLLDEGYDVDLYSSSSPGVLNKLSSSVGRLSFEKYTYNYSTHKIVTLFRFLWVQCKMFALALHYKRSENVVFYINTILPVGAALAAKLKGRKTVYHYHENAYVKGAAYRFLAWLMQRLATDIICVSEYQRSFLLRTAQVFFVPNALGQNLHRSLKPHLELGFDVKNVLMLSSLKDYKGTDKFIEMAAQMPEFQFTLVINDTQENIAHYIKHHPLSENITVYPRQNKVAEFYNRSSLVLNLSDRNRFIETFGLTVLEAMTAGLPVIVPTVGGVAEMVEDGMNGYKIDVQDLDGIEKQIKTILTDQELYYKLSQSALEHSRRYGFQNMLAGIKKVLLDPQ